MLKRAGLICAVMLSVPALASAWTISARVASGSGNVQNGGLNLLPTPGYVSLSNTLDASKDLTVVPAAGYALGTVLVDGKVATPVSGLDTFRVNFNNTNSHSITAYFNATTIKYTVTSTQAADGSFTVQQTSPTSTVPTTGNLTNVPNGAKIKVTAVPKAGFTVSKITVGAVDYVPQAGYVAGQALVASDIVISGNTSVTATYATIPAVSVTGAVFSPNDILNTASATVPVKLTVNTTASATAGALTYAFDIKDSNGVAAVLTDGSAANATLTVAGNVASFGYKKVGYTEHHLNAGDYTATVTVTSAGGAPAVTKTFNFTVKDAVAFSTGACTGCHNNSTPTIVANWGATKHAESEGHDQTKCFRCHNGKGPLYAQTNAYTGPVSVIIGTNGGLGTDTPTDSLPTPIGCVTCHTDGPHGGALRPVASWDPNGNGAVDQYDLCTSCHTLQDANGDKLEHFHRTQSMRDGLIADTHYDDPATGFLGNPTGVTGNPIEGYVVRTKGATPCADCHNVHMAETQSAVVGESTIQQQWARSGHAGKVLALKEAAVDANGVALNLKTTAGLDARSAVPVNGTSGAAWEHYNWDQTTGTGNRAACQKCHTATGAANFLDAAAAGTPYVAANNNFDHLKGWTAATGSTQNELLYCWGCHKSATTGELRNPGAVTADYNFKGVKAKFPDVQASNVCLVCHSGRESGESLDTITNFAASGFKNSHYMAAGGLMYAKEGFTAFVDPATVLGTTTYGATLTADTDGGALTSKHRTLGTSANTVGLTTDGPCVTCHYVNGEHELEITGAAFTAVCVKCHTAEGTTTLTAENFKTVFVEEQAVPFNTALDIVKTILHDKYKIGYDKTTNPYFFELNADGSINNTSAGAVTNWSTRDGQAVDGKKLMGACFNLNLLTRDPAAYVHARSYTRRLIYDSLDFLIDGNINLDVSSYLGTNGNIGLKPADASGATANDAVWQYFLSYDRTTKAWKTPERP